MGDQEDQSNSYENEKNELGGTRIQWNTLDLRWTEKDKFKRDATVFLSRRRRCSTHSLSYLPWCCPKKYVKYLLGGNLMVTGSSKYPSKQGRRESHWMLSSVMHSAMIVTTTIKVSFTRGCNRLERSAQNRTWSC